MTTMVLIRPVTLEMDTEIAEASIIAERANIGGIHHKRTITDIIVLALVLTAIALVTGEKKTARIAQTTGEKRPFMRTAPTIGERPFFAKINVHIETIGTTTDGGTPNVTKITEIHREIMV